MPERPAVGNDNSPVLNLLRAEANQCRTVRTIDGGAAANSKAQIGIITSELGLLERNEPSAHRIRAADR